MKLTLHQKGFAVIAGLLAVQLGFLVFCGYLLNQAEFFAAQETRSRAILGRCNWLGALVANTTLSCFAYAVTGDEQCLDIYNGSKNDIQPLLLGLKEEFTDNKAQLQRVESGIKLSDQLRLVLDSTAQQPPISPRNEQLVQLVRLSLVPTLAEMYKLRHDLLAEEQKQVKQVPAAEATHKQAIYMRLTVAIIIDILATVTFFYICTLNLTRRLAVLSENALRFARREHLHDPIGGSDEIADLDTVFHGMATSLKIAEQRKQEFLSMISHDLRTPLSNVQTSLEFVMEGHQGPLPEGVNEWLGRANTNVQTVLSLINELLEIERIEAGSLNLDYAEVELEELLRRSVAAVSALAQRKQITIEKPQVADQYIDADEDRLLRVFINLLGNALKFSDKGSTITISFKELTESVEFSVADQGRGIPPDQLEKIFDRYHQVTADDARKLGGSGLGLAITKAIIEAHGGTIVAQSEVDKGSTFTLRIPKKKPGKSERQKN